MNIRDAHLMLVSNLEISTSGEFDRKVATGGADQRADETSLHETRVRIDLKSQTGESKEHLTTRTSLYTILSYYPCQIFISKYNMDTLSIPS